MKDTIKNISIRTLIKPGDIGSIIQLHGTLYAMEYQWDNSFEGYVAEGMAKFILNYIPNKDRLWIAESENKIVGAIAITDLYDGSAQLRWFIVHPSVRKQGLGKTLLNNAIQFSLTADYSSIILWTVKELTSAARLYTSAGFVKTEELTHHTWGKIVTEERYELRLVNNLEIKIV